MTLRTVKALRHIGFEDLGSFEAPLREAGYEIEYVDVAERNLGDQDPLGLDLLVVLGGPIGVYEHETYPFVSEEIRLLQTRLEAELPTLGICLGAQLMAAALGVHVYPGPTKEIDWSEIELASSDEFNPLDSLRGISVLHWHGDTFDLPDGCSLLASTALCRNQAFSRGPNVLGLPVSSGDSGHPLRALAYWTYERVGDGWHQPGYPAPRCAASCRQGRDGWSHAADRMAERSTKMKYSSLCPPAVRFCQRLSKRLGHVFVAGELRAIVHSGRLDGAAHFVQLN